MIASFPSQRTLSLKHILSFLKGPALLVIGMLYILMGILMNTLPQAQAQQRNVPHTTQHQQHTHTVTKKVFIMPPVSKPNAPTADSLGLGVNVDRAFCHVADRQKWIDQAWNDAWDVETNKGTDFPTFFVRQIRQESGFCQYNSNGTALGSSAGALGIAQFEPGTAASHGVNPYDPANALLGAARLMLTYIHKYNDYKKALAAYNRGEGGMDYCNTFSDWYGCLPIETRNYITVITGNA